ARLLLAAIAPMDLCRLDAIFVLHHAAHPDHGRDLIFGHADALAAQILGLLDARVGADVHARMTEDARDERRNGDVGRGAGRYRAQVARERELRDVELVKLEGAVEGLLRVERQVGDGAAVDLDAAIPDRARAVVIAARDRDGYLDHGSSFVRSGG